MKKIFAGCPTAGRRLLQPVFSHDSQSGRKYKVLNRGDVWFTAIMFRGFVELYGIDHNSLYIDALEKIWISLGRKCVRKTACLTMIGAEKRKTIRSGC